jgi:hypothetical protein
MIQRVIVIPTPIYIATSKLTIYIGRLFISLFVYSFKSTYYLFITLIVSVPHISPQIMSFAIHHLNGYMISFYYFDHNPFRIDTNATPPHPLTLPFPPQPLSLMHCIISFILLIIHPSNCSSSVYPLYVIICTCRIHVRMLIHTNFMIPLSIY